ncbi:hypothetical protein [Massilia sp. LjRoot122]|uniref:hypothetical protein n=1 Tax=Massilia sp. LjRoot122 TaxID=3342257 RepID=UPI003ECEA6BB
MNTAFFGRLIGLLVCSALTVLTIILVLLRLFGVLFFLGDNSLWAFVPAIVIVALLFAAMLRQARRRLLAGTCVLWYLSSIYFDGWDTVVGLTASGHFAWFEAAEAALITVFALACVLPRVQSSAAESDH